MRTDARMPIPSDTARLFLPHPPSRGANPIRIATSTHAKIYMLSIPEMTDWIIGNYTAVASGFYIDASTLNEHAAEIWLHRGFVNKTALLVDDPSTADIILVPSYIKLHALVQRLVRKSKLPRKMELVESHADWADAIVDRIAVFYKNHKILLLTPCVSLEETEKLGVKHLVKTLQTKFGQDAVYSVGFERNTAWQALPPSHIIVIPYVLRLTSHNTISVFDYERHGIFYRGDLRPKAVRWSGCNRSMMLPLAKYSHGPNTEGVNVQLFNKASRMAQEDYNDMVQHSDFCLAVCGDTVTSRSLASYMAAGCIPVRIGSRLRGHCDEPCHPGWGWTFTKGLSHLPYPSIVDWSRFPEVDELMFADDPLRELRIMLDTFKPSKRRELRQIMRETHRAFIYGFGNPVKPTAFGDAVDYLTRSLADELTAASDP